MVVICPQRRARYPSSRSVAAAAQKDRQRQPFVGDDQIADRSVNHVLLHQRGHQQRHEKDPDNASAGWEYSSPTPNIIRMRSPEQLWKTTFGQSPAPDFGVS